MPPPVTEEPAQKHVKGDEKGENEQRHWIELAICVAGIYASFLTWAVLQERVATTPYGVDARIFRASHCIMAIQSTLACLSGIAFLNYKRKRGNPRAQYPLIPNWPVARGYFIVAAAQALSNPFQYGSLRYVDYLTLLLAKSCKLVPVMAVHVVLYRKRFPTYKYLVVGLITTGVSLFSIYHPSEKSKSSGDNENWWWGLVLLGVNLVLDGIYNTTQDEMFSKHKVISGPHMMVVLNALTMTISVCALVATSGQYNEVKWFAKNHPLVFRDILLFGLCGALGQIFIFITLEYFGSLVLVTTTVTRKMASMLLSVAIFGHQLSPMQWLGVGLVFGGIVGEAAWKRLRS